MTTAELIKAAKKLNAETDRNWKIWNECYDEDLRDLRDQKWLKCLQRWTSLILGRP